MRERVHSTGIEYPESDGEPLGETDPHIRETIALIEVLKDRYRDDPGVYAGGDLLFYYEEGNVGAMFSPDAFVVLGVENRERRVFKLWEEGKAPDFVMEVTSKKTRFRDRGDKKVLCAELGVREYFLFDPTSDYLEPTLQGFRLVDGGYERVFPGADGGVLASTIGVRFVVEGDQLRYVDDGSGDALLRAAEVREELAARNDELAARNDELAARNDELAARERELDELRRRIAELEDQG